MYVSLLFSHDGLNKFRIKRKIIHTCTQGNSTHTHIQKWQQQDDKNSSFLLKYDMDLTKVSLDEKY